MPKSMILLMDGTGANATANRFTNVYAINQLIAESKRSQIPEQRRTQVSFYLPGLGTPFTVSRSQTTRNMLGLTQTVRQLVFGDNLEQLILRAYINICANYEVGDEIIAIGFSRGAVAARILSRLISDFGVLTSDMLMNIDRLWNEFVEISREPDDRKYYRAIADLKKQLQMENSRPVFEGSDVEGNATDDHPSIKFLGLFDSVIGANDGDLCLNVNLRDKFPAKRVQNIVHILSMHDSRGEYEFKRFDIPPQLTGTLREMWMPGVHSDVGGGYPDDFISIVSLLTMADFLRELGGVQLVQPTYKDLCKRLRRRIADRKLIVNAEPMVVQHRSRAPFIRAHDELHPLHGFLVGQEVAWKGAAEGKEFKNMIADVPTFVDPKLKGRFDSWISE